MGCQVSMWEVELAEDGSAAFDVDKFKVRAYLRGHR